MSDEGRPTYMPVLLSAPWWTTVEVALVFVAALAVNEAWWVLAWGAAIVGVLVAAVYLGMVLAARPAALPPDARVVTAERMARLVVWSVAAVDGFAAVLLLLGGDAAAWGGGAAASVAGVWAAGVALDPWGRRIERRDGVWLAYRWDGGRWLAPRLLKLPRS